jgi:hypothetical protein
MQESNGPTDELLLHTDKRHVEVSQSENQSSRLHRRVPCMGTKQLLRRTSSVTADSHTRFVILYTRMAQLLKLDNSSQIVVVIVWFINKHQLINGSINFYQSLVRKSPRKSGMSEILAHFSMSQ